MSISAVVVPGNRASDLDKPVCEAHGLDGAFVVERDETDRDGEYQGLRDIACDRCLPDVLRAAMIAYVDGRSFTPPIVSQLGDLDVYRPWNEVA